MDAKKLFPDLQKMSAEELFEKLVRHNGALAASDPSAMIETRLVISGGVEVSGSPISVDESKNSIVATASGLAYLNVRELVVLEVLDLEGAGPLIAIPPVSPAVPAASPSRSDLRSELASLNKLMSPTFRLEVTADVLDDPTFGDAGKNQFVEFLGMIEHALTSIAEDPVGEITIGSLEQISIIQAAGQLAAERSGPVMVIAVPFGQTFAPNFGAQLQTELQRAL